MYMKKRWIKVVAFFLVFVLSVTAVPVALVKIHAANQQSLDIKSRIIHEKEKIREYMIWIRGGRL